MARRADYYLTVGDGPLARSVGYSVSDRGTGYLGVRFTDGLNRRREVMTECKKKDANYHTVVAKILVRAFPECFPRKEVAALTPWDEAIAKAIATAGDLRPATTKAYQTAADALRRTLSADGLDTTSPAEITPAIATRFAALFLSTPYKRSPRKGAKTYKRSAQTVLYAIRQLSALWRAFVDLQICEANPWKAVRKPKTNRQRKRVPTEDEMAVFVAYLKGRYPTWERLHLLIDLKALAGCRTYDLCQLRSEQLKAGRVVWDGSQTKTREGRAVLVPEDMFAALVRLAGPVHLWQHMMDDIRQHRPGRNPIPEQFSAKTLATVLSNIFREFHKAHPTLQHLTPHSLRRRAITLVATATGSVDATAQMIGLGAATARNYYLDASRAFQTDELFKRMAKVLRVSDAPANPPQMGQQSGTTLNTKEQQSK